MLAESRGTDPSPDGRLLTLKINDPSMDQFKITIDRQSNTISVFNNGRGIPIQMHEKEQMYIPELIFGNL